nr:hypothetical protein [Mucilaginibacter sp. L294]
MLKSISWTDYFTAVAILAAIWYGIIALAFYRKEISDFLKGKYKFPIRKKANPAEVETNEDNKEDHSFEELEGIVTDIRHSILEEAGNKANKDELLTQLMNRLANYGGLRQPAFRVALNNFIIQYGESICGVAFSEEELDEAWETLPR